MVFTPKLCDFSSVGIFPITCQASELDNVNIKLYNWIVKIERGDLEDIVSGFYFCFYYLETGNVKILTLGSNIVQALSVVPNLLAYFPSPFYNVKYVKLPQGYRESTLSSAMKSYLLGGSSRATVVTTSPKDGVNAHTAPVFLTAQNMEEPLATATKKLVDSQDIHKEVFVDILDTRVQEETMVENFGVDAGRARQVGALVQGFGELVMNAPVAGSGNDQDGGNAHTAAVPFTAQNMEDSLAMATKKLVDSQDIHKCLLIFLKLGCKRNMWWKILE